MRTKLIILPLLAAILLSGCNNDWDDHYDNSGKSQNENLMELISSDSNLSVFAQALRQTGTDKLLESDQTYTVWAPSNQALAGINLSDSASVFRMVNNHVARFTNPTSTKGHIVMLNGKSMTFTDSKTFNGAPISEADISASNGVLHILSEQIVYLYNIREMIDADDRFNSLSEFIGQFDRKIYNEELSTTHDSVFTDYNPLLEHSKYGIGDIADEDSLFTMILPADEAWKAELERVMPSYQVYHTDQVIADSTQQVQTAQAILGGLTFRGIINEQADSLISVTGEVIRPVADYLAGYERIEASNGIIYIAHSQLNANDSCVWNHILTTEAEEMDSRVAVSGTNCFIRNTDINSLVQGVSANSYLEASSGNVDGGVTFDISNVLATKYDVYVDFVNPVVDGPNLAEEKTKCVFRLIYRGANGRNSVQNVNTPVEITGVDKEGNMNPGIISVKAISGLKIPVSDYYDGLWLSDERHSAAEIKPTTTLQVSTRVNATDARNGYVRKFRVDRVRFVPVTE